jgi:phosphopantothenoylcysteine decarboxylase / phosphopantothenate---cysteine ligase
MKRGKNMNDDVKVDIIGNYLQGKTIALCISGGIAAIETPKLARALRRYGAAVKAYTTSEASKFIGQAALEWATESETVSVLSGMAEHICKEDLVIVCPATTNTTNKIFAGIADNPVTTLVASALGAKKPVYIVPTMHESLYNNPFFQRNIASAEQYGIHIIPGRKSEGKEKIPKLDTIVAAACRELSSDPIKGKSILVTGGPTPVHIDRTRIVTNIFKGALAAEIAKDAYLRGADVKLLMANTGIPIPEYIPTTIHHDFDEYLKNVMAELQQGYDAGIFSAAVADYKPTTVYDGKLPSRGALKNLPFTDTVKVIDLVKERYPGLYMATFKHECDITKDRLFEIARSRLAKGHNVVVANREEDMVPEHKAYIVQGSGVTEAYGKPEIARRLLDIVGRDLAKE